MRPRLRQSLQSLQVLAVCAFNTISPQQLHFGHKHSVKSEQLCARQAVANLDAELEIDECSQERVDRGMKACRCDWGRGNRYRGKEFIVSEIFGCGIEIEVARAVGNPRSMARGESSVR